MRRSLTRLVVLLAALFVVTLADDAEAQEFCWVESICVGWCYEWGWNFFSPENLVVSRCCHLDGTCPPPTTVSQGCCWW